MESKISVFTANSSHSYFKYMLYYFRINLKKSIIKIKESNHIKV